MSSVAFNFVGGIPYQLLTASIKVAIHKSRKFKNELIHLQFTLDRLDPAMLPERRRFRESYNLSNDVIDNLELKMEEGRVLVNIVSEFSMWNIRIWCNCCNCIGPDFAKQLSELDRSLRLLIDQFDREGTQLLLIAERRTREWRDKRDDFDKRLYELVSQQRIRNNNYDMDQGYSTRRTEWGDSVQAVASSSGGGDLPALAPAPAPAPAPALGLVFQQLFGIFIQVNIKNMNFKRLVERFKSTLNCLTPLIEEIAEYNSVLHLSEQQVDNLIKEIKIGVELVHKCSKVRKRDNYRNYQYANMILNFNRSFQMLFIQLKRQVESNVRDSMDPTNEIEVVIKCIEGSGVLGGSKDQMSGAQPETDAPQINMQEPGDVIPETLVDSANVDQESDLLPTNQMESEEISREVETLDSAVRSIEEGVMETEVVEEEVVDLQEPGITVTLVDHSANVDGESDLVPKQIECEVDMLDSTTRNMDVEGKETEVDEVFDYSTRIIMPAAGGSTGYPLTENPTSPAFRFGAPRNVKGGVLNQAEPPTAGTCESMVMDSTSNKQLDLQQHHEEEQSEGHCASFKALSGHYCIKFGQGSRKEISTEERTRTCCGKRKYKGNVVCWILPFKCYKQNKEWSFCFYIRPFQQTKKKHSAQGRFPEECLANIISFTSPADACRLSSVSRSFHYAADSDEVWEHFLPPQLKRSIQYQSPSSSTSIPAAKSKKELYLALSDNSVLIDNGKMSLSVDKWSGKRCYMVCARELCIIWSDHKSNFYWRWISLPKSRFEEVANLESVNWLEIRGKIDMSMLSPFTLYKAYLVYMLTDEKQGFHVSVEVAVCARHHGFEYGSLAVALADNKNMGYLDPDMDIMDGVRRPKKREDGWLEMELGEYLCKAEENGELEMMCVEIKDLCRKSGLIVEGIEVRPETKEKAEARKSKAEGKKAMNQLPA